MFLATCVYEYLKDTILDKGSNMKKPQGFQDKC